MVRVQFVISRYTLIVKCIVALYLLCSVIPTYSNEINNAVELKVGDIDGKNSIENSNTDYFNMNDNAIRGHSDDKMQRVGWVDGSDSNRQHNLPGGLSLTDNADYDKSELDTVDASSNTLKDTDEAKTISKHSFTSESVESSEPTGTPTSTSRISATDSDQNSSRTSDTKLKLNSSMVILSSPSPTPTRVIVATEPDPNRPGLDKTKLIHQSMANVSNQHVIATPTPTTSTSTASSTVAPTSTTLSPESTAGPSGCSSSSFAFASLDPNISKMLFSIRASTGGTLTDVEYPYYLRNLNDLIEATSISSASASNDLRHSTFVVRPPLCDPGTTGCNAPPHLSEGCFSIELAVGKGYYIVASTSQQRLSVLKLTDSTFNKTDATFCKEQSPVPSFSSEGSQWYRFRILSRPLEFIRHNGPHVYRCSNNNAGLCGQSSNEIFALDTAFKFVAPLYSGMCNGPAESDSCVCKYGSIGPFCTVCPGYSDGACVCNGQGNCSFNTATISPICACQNGYSDASCSTSSSKNSITQSASTSSQLAPTPTPVSIIQKASASHLNIIRILYLGFSILVSMLL